MIFNSQYFFTISAVLTLIKWNAAIPCLWLITGAQLNAGETLFVTPGSYFKLNTTIPVELISCDFRSEETRQSNIKINALEKYNTTKYQITAVATEPYYHQALQELFFMRITYPYVSEIHLTISSKNHNLIILSSVI